jgi:hypothetical protein
VIPTLPSARDVLAVAHPDDPAAVAVTETLPDAQEPVHPIRVLLLFFLPLRLPPLLSLLPLRLPLVLKTWGRQLAARGDSRYRGRQLAARTTSLICK